MLVNREGGSHIEGIVRTKWVQVKVKVGALALKETDYHPSVSLLHVIALLSLVVNVTVALNAEDHARLAEACRKLNMTVYSFSLDAVLKALHLEEARDPSGKVVSEKVLQLVEALKNRKYALYQFQDYSDKNHRDWLAGRNPNASKREVQLAVAIFRGGGIE